MNTLLPLTESTNLGGVRGGKCKQSRGSYVKLMPVKKAQIAKYALQARSQGGFGRFGRTALTNKRSTILC